MNLEEDAMLVAIGRMSMEQAREKWSDEWADFIQALSRWKSIHQLLRIARLNAIKEELAANIADAQERITTLINVCDEKQDIQTLIDAQADDIWYMQQFSQNARERFQRKGKQSENIIFGFDPTSPEYAPTTHRGKKHYQDHVRYAIEAAWLDVQAMLAGGEEALKQLIEESHENQKKLKEATERVNKVADELTNQQLKINQTQDEIDITKPYAMGLLVADIFYSLAAALQGDIY